MRGLHISLISQTQKPFCGVYPFFGRVRHYPEDWMPFFRSVDSGTDDFVFLPKKLLVTAWSFHFLFFNQRFVCTRTAVPVPHFRGRVLRRYHRYLRPPVFFIDRKKHYPAIHLGSDAERRVVGICQSRSHVNSRLHYCCCCVTAHTSSSTLRKSTSVDPPLIQRYKFPVAL